MSILKAYRGTAKGSPSSDSEFGSHDEEKQPLFSDEKRVRFKEAYEFWSLRNIIQYGLLFLAGAFSFTALGFLLAVNVRPAATNSICAERLSSYSPALPAVRYSNVQFNGSFTGSNKFRGYPNPDLDDAWSRISALYPIRISDQEMNFIGKPGTAVQYPREEGGGYMGELEVFHQLHCLNLLRIQVYRDYYTSLSPVPPIFRVNETVRRSELDHCVDILRQSIMCTGDVTIATANWVQGHPRPIPDFSTMHVCRDFDALLEWASERDAGEVEKLQGDAFVYRSHL